MPKLRVNVLGGRPLLDIASYARRGPGRPDRFSPTELAQVSRTVRRVPEVMVKVLSKGSTDLASVSRHFGYVGRYGDLGVETDQGQQLQGRSLGRQLLEDWDLDLEDHRRQSDLASALGRQSPKLVHKLMFSMPAGTPPKAVLIAARNFLREEFALKHRYAFVLHTDEPHPHVHAVVKAVSEQGTRLHIKKATLRAWRQQFAKHLRDQGIEANATERAVRGQIKGYKKDGIFRAGQRAASTHLRHNVEMVASDLLKGRLRIEKGKETVTRTRNEVERGWRLVSDLLLKEGQPDLATEVRDFVEQMPPPRTDWEQIAADLHQRARVLRAKEKPVTR